MTEIIPLERDPIWSAFNEYTWESFQGNYLPKCGLIPLVNEEVRKKYRAIHKLMAYSYFEYEFFDIAAAQMSMLMEMAMVWKYEAVTGEPWKKKGRLKKGELRRDLKNLFRWLRTNGHLDRTHFVSDDLLRGTRNYYAHPKKHGFGGGINLSRIKELIFLINELYDPQLQRRNSLAVELNNWLMKHNQGRKVLSMPNRVVPLSDLVLAFIDCSVETPHYFLGCFPLLKLDDVDENSRYAPQTLMFIQLAELKLHDSYLVGIEVSSGKEVKIELANEAMASVIDQWEKKLKTMVHVDAQMPAWKTMELFSLVEELKTNYYIQLSASVKKPDDHGQKN